MSTATFEASQGAYSTELHAAGVCEEVQAAAAEAQRPQKRRRVLRWREALRKGVPQVRCHIGMERSCSVQCLHTVASSPQPSNCSGLPHLFWLLVPAWLEDSRITCQSAQEDLYEGQAMRLLDLLLYQISC